MARIVRFFVKNGKTWTYFHYFICYCEIINIVLFRIKANLLGHINSWRFCYQTFYGNRIKQMLIVTSQYSFFFLSDENYIVYPFRYLICQENFITLLCFPAKDFFRFGNRWKTEGTKSVEYGGCSKHSYFKFHNFFIAKTPLWQCNTLS